MACLDTSYIIDFLRGENKAKEMFEQLEIIDNNIFIPAPVVMELISRAYLSNDIQEEESKVISFLSSAFILNLEIKAAILAGKIEADLIKSGNIIEPEDIMIAATCISKNETLITRNKKHFERIKGLKIQSY